MRSGLDRRAHRNEKSVAGAKRRFRFEVTSFMAEHASIAPSIDRMIAPQRGAVDWVLGQNLAVRQIARHAERAAAADCTVLISGETGTGKELWGQLIPQRGPRAERHGAR